MQFPKAIATIPKQPFSFQPIAFAGNLFGTVKLPLISYILNQLLMYALQAAKELAGGIDHL